MSSDSDAYERAVAKSINSTIKGLRADRPVVGTSYADVLVEYKSVKSWVEVKMNHTDNLFNIRLSLVNGLWRPNTDEPSVVATKFSDLFNNSRESKEWIRDLKHFLVEKKSYKGNPNKMTIYSTATQRRADINCVSVELMKQFLRTRSTKNICKISNVDVGRLITEHYLRGKKEPAYYLSSGDDFLKFGDYNPFKIPNLPKLSGTNVIVLRVGDRSESYEIQPEIKLRSIPTSNFSVKPGSSKPNPFKYIGIK